MLINILKNNKVNIRLGLIAPVAGIILLFSCQDVIKVDLNNTSPQTVIEGSINNLSDTVIIALSKTTDYFNPQSITPITDAQVSISDTAGNIYQPTLTTHGFYYFFQLKGLPQNTYTLKVQANGATYSASSKMPNMVSIDSLNILKSEDGDRENVLACYIKDPAGVKNYYRLRVFMNGTLLTSKDSIEPISVLSDKYFDGRFTPLRMPSRRFGIDYFLPGDTLKVQLMSIDLLTYNYLRELRSITNTGRLTSTSTPDNPDNNISNGALGYFAAWAISEKTLIVK